MEIMQQAKELGDNVFGLRKLLPEAGYSGSLV